MRFRHRFFFFPALFLMMQVCAQPAAHSQSILLDDFETLSGWKAIPSEGAKLNITSGEGKTGKAMVMEFDFASGSGYTIAQKSFSLALPANYQFTFDIRADAPVNNFEFKLLDDKENVFWIKRLNVEYPKNWEKQRIKKRHITFGWGPSGPHEMRRVDRIEFVVSAGTGGKGKVYIDNFRFEPIDDARAESAHAEFDASSLRKGGEPTINEKGTFVSNWKGVGEHEWISINFNHLKEIGGLVIDWENERYATSFDVLLSDDGKDWTTAYSVTNGNGGRDYVSLPEKDARFLKINFNQSKGGKGYAIARMDVKDPEFSDTPNDFFTSIAKDSPKGLYPKYFLDQQCYWTIVGTSSDTKEALINEIGAIEVDKQRFSLEPFLYIDGKLITWNDVSPGQSLMNKYLPIPSVVWKYAGLELTVRAFSAGTAGNSTLVATYTITNNRSDPLKGKLFIALRPFQVNPKWQWLNSVGGVARIDSIRSENGLVHVQDKIVIPVSTPSGFGASNFDGGDMTEYLQTGLLPSAQGANDTKGFAAGALQYDFDVPPGASKSFHVAVPFRDWNGSPTPEMGRSGDQYVTDELDATRQFWESKLNTVRIQLPAFAQPIINTIKSNLAYIFINRDGPGIQPGSRSYERSWIRDGSLTSTALLEFGMKDEVRTYLDWYTTFQFPGGKIPCVVDERGGDPTAEHDSNGEYIYAVMQYFDFTKDTVWLRAKFDNVAKAVQYIQSLRAERKTDVYKNGTPEQQACFGLVPESISHEGYSAKPMHSYWDDFFTLRGLKDATTIATILGRKELAGEWAAERDDLKKDLYISMRRAMKNKNIDYIPGCVELGDFDATSTTIGIQPAGELGSIPEPQLHNTFDKYFEYFINRRDGKLAWDAYTPYENRIIGSYVYLGQKERAHEVLNFLMKGRRPQAWNQWAEVVWRDPATPKFIGDMPHTWCGSDFIRSVRAMFVYEREQDTALVLCAGIADAWLNDSAGVTVSNLPTYYGDISYSIRKEGKKIVVSISGDVTMPTSKIVFKSPLSQRVKSAMIGNRKVKVLNGNELVIDELPAKVELSY